MFKIRWAVTCLVAFVALGALPLSAATGGTVETKRYIVVFEKASLLDGVYAVDRATAVALVEKAGGAVVHDLFRQTGVLVVDSPNALLDETLRSTAGVEEAAEDFAWKAFPSYDEALTSGQLTVLDASSVPGGGPEQTADPLEPFQWSMQQIRAPAAHAIQAGSRAVQVGILDSGIDGDHVDFFVDQQGTNVNCALGRDFVPLGPSPLTIGTPCDDNQFHGTHVAGIVAAQANALGVVGVAPNVTLIPVKVCDTTGYCYSSSSAAAITYAGDAKFEVINMSYFVDDDRLLGSTMYKCMSDPIQRAFRKANERAIQYARNQGVVPVAALGNSDDDLTHPPEPYENECDVVPAETQGVIGTMALGPQSEKAFYSNYGEFATDVAAPGGNPEEIQEIGSCDHEVLSTLPFNTYGCISGTSMASPHAAGVAALIVSQFGRVGNDAGEPDVVMRPQEVENYLQSTTIDLVNDLGPGVTKTLKGYDECFGNGRIDAVRAVLHDTSVAREVVPVCPEGQTDP